MFQPLSLITPVLILLPNLMFFKFPPQNMPSEQNKKWIFTAAEGIGRVGVILFPLFLSIHIQTTYEIISLLVMLLSLMMYYVGWIRYFRNDRQYKLLFAPLWGIPVPLAIFPSLYFLFAAVLTHSYGLFIFSVILAIGHIPNSLTDYNRNRSLKL
ncbi:hypothetical protein EBB07_13905 [Paenibacillaceae bacterium]|nr:hypothetical protein EBB07_13905 [Paenibacillaceae bacterium]